MIRVKDFVVEAINELANGNTYFITGDGLDGLVWSEGSVNPPTEEEINQEILRLQEEFTNTEYARLRKAEYDKLNQDEMRFDDLVNGTTTWQDAINTIKQEIPKGGN